MITSNFKIYRLNTYTSPINNFDNVVGSVEWLVTFTDGVNESSAAGKTYLNVDNLVSITPLEQLTPEQVYSWIEKEEGPTFFDTLKENHAANLKVMELDSKMSVAKVPFALYDSTPAVTVVPSSVEQPIFPTKASGKIPTYSVI